MTRFDNIKYDIQAQVVHVRFKFLFKRIEEEVDQLAPGRAKSIVYTKLEEAFMWAGKALRDEQLDRDKIAELNP